jgi:hypothetical protein
MGHRNSAEMLVPDQIMTPGKNPTAEEIFNHVTETLENTRWLSVFFPHLRAHIESPYNKNAYCQANRQT